MYSGNATPGSTAPAGSEGVGEHVRTKSHPAMVPVKLRTEMPSAPIEEKSVSSAGSASNGASAYFEVRSSRLT